ncbi:MAG: MBL fold metallo-hydrolase [Burkholderiales bacterium]|nr:MBL fold metallo-hydrolase [Burkholderiales bacterium]
MKRTEPRSASPSLTFLGAAGEVTGSCHLVETGTHRFLLDCGLFQGGREAATRNRQFAFKPADIDFVILSHAHLDHSGLIPRLVAQGFRGRVHATTATADLLSVLLPDSGHLQEREAERDSRDRKRALPALYTAMEAQQSLKRISHHRYGEAFEPAPGVTCLFRDAGHILGSATVEVRLQSESGEHVLVFSGDLGQRGHPIVRDPEPIAHADTLLVESTYGDRLHKTLTQTLDELAYAITDTLHSKQGNVVIPAFAVGRTQDILYFIAKLARQGRVPPLTVYVDSPMAEAATRLVMAHPELHDDDSGALRDLIAGRIHGARVVLVSDVEGSRRINSVKGGAVILSASGMCEGGRIRHHLFHNLPRKESAVVFAGFQAAGTLGRRIVDGAKSVRIFAENIPVRARVFTIGGLSAHADQAGLLQWLGGFTSPPRNTWVVHGEALSAMAFRDRIGESLGWKAAVAMAGKTITLD